MEATAGSAARDSRRRLILGLLAGGLCLLQIAAWYPGIMEYDSRLQYIQVLSGHFGDWHPPVMARLWALLSPLGPVGAPLFVTHALVYWGGLAILAFSLDAARFPKAAVAVLLIGTCPPFFFLEGRILKDVGFASALTAAFALAHCLRTTAVRGRPLLYAAALLLLSYAFLTRANAIFAVAPVAAYLFFPRNLANLRFVGLCAAIVLVGIGLTGTINHRILRAEPENPMRSLTSFDRAGIAHYSRDASVLPPNVSLGLIDRCYTPVLWDTLGSAGCEATALPPPNGSTWLKLIAGHPFAYAEHRLAHFNQAMIAYTSIHARPAAALGAIPLPWIGKTRFEDYNRPDDLLAVPLFAPAFFFVLGLAICCLAFARTARAAPPVLTGAWILSVSAVAYMAGFAVVGVSSTMRYQFYPMLAIALAAVLFCADRSLERRPVSPGEKGAIVLLCVTALLIVAGRHSSF